MGDTAVEAYEAFDSRYMIRVSCPFYGQLGFWSSAAVTVGILVSWVEVVKEMYDTIRCEARGYV